LAELVAEDVCDTVDRERWVSDRHRRLKLPQDTFKLIKISFSNSACVTEAVQMCEVESVQGEASLGVSVSFTACIR
jgi:hypothetical protein